MSDSVFRAARKARGLTTIQVGEMIGMSSVSVGRFETGKAHLSLPKLYAYAVAVGLEGLARELEPVVKVRSDHLDGAA